MLTINQTWIACKNWQVLIRYSRRGGKMQWSSILFHRHPVWAHFSLLEENKYPSKHKLIIKSVNPKISRIGRQKRNFFFSFLTKRTHWVNFFRKWHQKVRFPFLFFKICKTWKFGHRAFSGGHDAWNLAHVQHARTKRCLNMSFTQFVGHLLNFTRD